MAIDQTTVTGPILDTEGVAYTNATVRFIPRAPMGDVVEGATLADSPVDVDPDGSGDFSVDLAPNDAIPYDVFLLHALPDKTVRYPLGSILVPDQASASLQELLADFVPGPEPIPTVTQLNAALAAATDDADRAEAAADAAEVDAETASSKASAASASASAAAVSASLSQSAALAAGAPLFETTAAGISGTSDGEYFYVIGAAGGLSIYLNDTGTARLKGQVSPDRQNLLEVFGVSGIGDETTKIQAMVDYAGANGLRIDWPDGGRFEFSELDIDTPQNWYCLGKCELYSNKTTRTGSTFDSDYAIQIGGSEGAEIAVSADYEVGQRYIDLASVTGVAVGDILLLNSTRLQDTNRSGGWTEGQTVKVRSISGTRVFLEDKLAFSGKAAAVVTGTVDAITDGWNITLSDAMPGELRDRIVALTITDGSAAGERRFVTGASANGLEVMHDDSRDAWPAGLQVGDAYRYAWEATVTVIKPAKVHIDGLHLTRDAVTGASDEDRSFRGLRVQYADMPRIKNSTFENFPENNLHIVACWHPKLSNIETHGANRAWGTSSGTGYGISVDRCATPRVVDVVGRGNRRVIDLTGTRGYTTNAKIVRCHAVGGGLTYTGAEFWPTGTVQQSGFGSHGSGRFSEYIDCSAEDTWAAALLRGRAEVITNLHHVGYADRCVTMNHGGGHTVHGLVYDDRFSEIVRDADERHVISSDADKRAKNAVFITYEDEFVENLQIVLSDIVANSLSDAVVRCDGTGVTVRGLTIRNVDVTCSPEDTGQTSFELVRRNPTSPLAYCTFQGINLNEVSAYSSGVRAIDMVGANNVAEDAYIVFEGAYIVNIAQNSVVSLPVYRNSLAVSLVNYRGGATRPRGNMLVIEDEDATIHLGDQINVEALATKPTDGTGVTSGKVGINLKKSDSHFTIANNTGSTETFEVRGVL